MHAILEIGRHKSTRLESNLMRESINWVNATIGVLIRKKFQLINLESVAFIIEERFWHNLGIPMDQDTKWRNCKI